MALTSFDFTPQCLLVIPASFETCVYQPVQQVLQRNVSEIGCTHVALQASGAIRLMARESRGIRCLQWVSCESLPGRETEHRSGV